MKIGTIQQIIRHPVKSMGGEILPSCQVTPFGLYGDRSHAFVFADTPEGEGPKYVSIQSFAGMAAYRATLQNDQLTITSPTGHVSTWDDEHLLQEIATGAKASVKRVQFGYDEYGANWEDHILITTDASLRAISEAWGKGDIDNRRFRSNLIIALDTDQPFTEENWLGKEIAIGDIVLRATGSCIRCSYLNVDPYDATIDPTVLKTVVNTVANKFGMYFSVIKPGEVHNGDIVTLIDPS